MCQRSIIVHSASNPEEAVGAAEQRFAQLGGIHDWRIHAAIIEIVPISYDPDIGKGSAIWKPVRPEPVGAAGSAVNPHPTRLRLRRQATNALFGSRVVAKRRETQPTRLGKAP